MSTRQPSRTVAMISLILFAALSREPLTPLAFGALAQGPFSSMHMTYKRTFLKVNVAQVNVHVDTQTQQAIQAVAPDSEYSDATADQIAKVMMQSQGFVIQSRFLRD